MQLRGFCLVHDREQIAADAIRLRLDDAEHGVGGDRRVDGVAAALEHLHPGLGRERLGGGDNAVGRGDARTSCDHHRYILLRHCENSIVVNWTELESW